MRSADTPTVERLQRREPASEPRANAGSTAAPSPSAADANPPAVHNTAIAWLSQSLQKLEVWLEPLLRFVAPGFRRPLLFLLCAIVALLPLRALVGAPLLPSLPGNFLYQSDNVVVYAPLGTACLISLLLSLLLPRPPQ